MCLPIVINVSTTGASELSSCVKCRHMQGLVQGMPIPAVGAPVCT
jgi:hypothetical protein